MHGIGSYRSWDIFTKRVERQGERERERGREGEREREREREREKGKGEAIVACYVT